MFWDLTYVIPNWFSSVSMRIAQDVQQRFAIGTNTDQNQAQKFAQCVYKLQFIIYWPHLPSWQLLPVLAYSRLCVFHSSQNSCLLCRWSQPFIPADTDSSFSNLSGSLALTSLSPGVVSKCRTASAWWYFYPKLLKIFVQAPICFTLQHRSFSQYGKCTLGQAPQQSEGPHPQKRYIQGNSTESFLLMLAL